MAIPEPEPTACEHGFPLEEEIPGLRGFLRRLAGRRDDVEDVLQDTLARALRYRESFDPAGSLSGWLRRAALHVFLDHRRRAARAPRALGEADARLPDRRAPDPGIAEELRRALTRLGDVERDVALRFHARGETIAEIAAALAMPQGTVKSHLHRARHRLADAYRGGAER